MRSLSPRHTVTQAGTRLDTYHGGPGEGLPRHEHAYSHLTMCHAGRIVVRKADRELVMDRDTQPANLRANEWHEIEVLDEGTVFVNVFAEGGAA